MDDILPNIRCCLFIFTVQNFSELSVQLFKEREEQVKVKQWENKAKRDKTLSIQDLKNQIKTDRQNIVKKTKEYNDASNQNKEDLQAIKFLVKRSQLDDTQSDSSYGDNVKKSNSISRCNSIARKNLNFTYFKNSSFNNRK